MEPIDFRMPTSFARFSERAVLKFMKLMQANNNTNTPMMPNNHTNSMRPPTFLPSLKEEYKRHFAIGCKNSKTFEIHGSGGMLRFNLEDLNRLEFLDGTDPPTEQGARDLLVTDMNHPIFGHWWPPGHIIGYEHTFIAALAEFLECRSKDEDFHPNFSDGLAVQEVFDAVQRSAQTGQWAACPIASAAAR